MIKYDLVILPSFKRDYKRLKRKHIRVDNFTNALYHLQYYNLKILKSRYDDHALYGNWQGYRELHLKLNLLIKYKIHENVLLMIIFYNRK